MAKKEDKVKELRRKSRFAAMEGLRPSRSLPVPPRKAVKQAQKASKKLPYPVPPYPGAGLPQIFRWTQHEWWQLGKWQGLAAPVIALVALLTWEKEKELKEARWNEIEKEETRRRAAEVYGAFGRAKRRRKLLGFIPIP